MLQRLRLCYPSVPLIVNSLMPMPIVAPHDLEQINRELAVAAAATENCHFLDTVGPSRSSAFPLPTPASSTIRCTSAPGYQSGPNHQRPSGTTFSRETCRGDRNIPSSYSKRLEEIPACQTGQLFSVRFIHVRQSGDNSMFLSKNPCLHRAHPDFVIPAHAPAESEPPTVQTPAPVRPILTGYLRGKNQVSRGQKQWICRRPPANNRAMPTRRSCHGSLNAAPARWSPRGTSMSSRPLAPTAIRWGMF